MLDADVAAVADEFVIEEGGEEFAEAAVDGVPAADTGEVLHLGVPAFDAVLEIDGENTDVDGFDDVFAEFFEAFDLFGLTFERAVEAGVFDGDADVAAEGDEEFDVVRGEEIAFIGTGDAEPGDDAATGGAGEKR